jgi:hypothetical protein
MKKSMMKDVAGTVAVPTNGMPSEPKRFKIPSSSYGITANEAADTLLKAAEIKANKPLLKSALADLKTRRSHHDAVLNEAAPVDEGEDEQVY